MAASQDPRLSLLARSADPAEPFRVLAESIPQLVWTARPDGRLDYANQRWIDYCGIPIDAIQGWSWKQLLHPDDLAVALDRWTTALDNPGSFQNECQIRRHDGEYRWFTMRAEPIFDREGRYPSGRPHRMGAGR